jgi:hypothetical protein
MEQNRLVQKQLAELFFFFACNIPLFGNDMNKQINTSLNTIIFIR